MATISLPSNLTAAPNETLVVAVTIDDASDIQSVDLTVTFDTSLFTVSGLQQGALLSALDGGLNTNDDWTIQTNTSTPGELRITAFSAEPLVAGSSGELFELEFTVNAGVTGGSTTLDLTAGSVGINNADVPVTLVDSSVTIASSDSPPTTTGIGDVTVDEDGAATLINLFDAFEDAEDADADLIYRIDSNTNTNLFSGVNIDPNTGILTLNYALDASGQANLTIEAEDTAGQTVATTFGVTVNPVNDVPEADDRNGTTEQVESLSLNLLANVRDADNDTVQLASVTQPSNGTVVETGNGLVTYSPNPNFVGTDTFTYTVSDGAGGTDTASVTVTVTPLERTAAPSLTTDDLDDRSVVRGSLSQETIPLLSHFDDPFTTGLVAQFQLFDTSLGVGGLTEVLLFDQADSGAPLTVANFRTYVEDGDYTNTIIHRSVPDFVVQGGGFIIDGLGDTLNAPANSVSLVPTDPPVDNEPSAQRSNIRGTISVAKQGGDPDSGTSQWFFNLADNSANLDSQNGGFTAFGEVISGEDLATVEAIAALPRFNAVNVFGQGAFNELPLIVDDPAAPDVTGDENIVRYQSISLVQRDELTFAVVGNSNPNLVSGTINGTNLVLDYQASQVGSADITVRAINLVGETIEDTFTVTVTDLPPTTTGIANIAVNEDADNTSLALFDAFDDREDADTQLTYTLVSNSNGDLFTGVTIDSNTGVLTLDYGADANGEAQLTVQAQDTLGQTVNTSFTVTVNPVNDAPSFSLVGNQTVAEDAGAQTVTNFATNINPGGASDEASQALSFSLSTNNDNLFEVLPTLDPDTGTLTYTPAENVNGTASFTVTLLDDGGTDNGGDDSTSQTFEITVTPENDSPVAEDDQVNTAQGSGVTISVLNNDTDIDGDTLGIDSFTPASNGTVTNNGDGTLTYTPTLVFIGQDSFTYTVTDGADGTDTATVTIDVAANSAPNADDDSTATNEDEAVTFDLVGNDSDPEGDDFSITTVTDPTHGTVTTNGDGTVTYSPNPNFNGTDSFTYTITDTFGGTDTATVNLTVNPVNDAPVAQDDLVSLDEDGSGTFNVLTNDTDVDGHVDENGLTVIDFSQPNFGVLVSNGNGSFTYTPTANVNGSDSFTYTIQDPSGATSNATVTLTINAVNDAPTITAPTALNGLEDTSLTITGLVVSDLDAGTAPVTVTLSVDSGTLTVSETVIDGLGAGDISNNGSPSPILTGTLAQINTTLGQAQGLVFTPDANAIASTDLVVTLDDGGNTGIGGSLSTSETITLNLTPVNDAPVFNLAGNQTIVEDAGAQTVANFATNINPGGASDEASQGLGFNITTNNNGLFEVLPTLDPNTGTLTYTPAGNASGTATVTVTLLDDGGTDNGGDDSTSQTFEITVTPENDPPVAEDDQVNTGQGIGVTIAVLDNDTDIDGDSLGIDSFTPASNGTVTNNGNGTLTYTPNLAFIGQDSFTYTVTDGENGTNTATVTIDVAANSAPNANNDSATTNEDVPITLNLVANDNDPEGDDFSITTVTEPTHGTVTNNGDGTVTYSPTADFNGADSFTYTITDTLGGTDTATVTLTINPVNDGPVAQDDQLSLDEDGSGTLNVLANDTDVDGELTVTDFSQPDFGVLVNNGNGSFTYTPTANFNGVETFSYTIQDSQGATSDATVTLTINAVNDAPTITAPTGLNGLEDTPLAIAGLTVADLEAGTAPVTVTLSVDSGTLTVSEAVVDGLEADDINNNGSASLVLTGTLEQINTTLSQAQGLVFTPVTHATASTDLTVTLDDGGNTGSGGNLTASETITLNLTPVNDAPVLTLLGAQTVDEDAGPQTVANFASGITPGGGTDESSQSLTLSVSNDNNGLFSSQPTIDDLTGQLTYTPATDIFGVATVTVQVRDDGGTDNGGNDTTEQTFTITVNAVDDDPIATDDTATTPQTQAVTIAVLTNDRDIEGDSLTVESFTNPSNGTLTQTEGGNFTYTPNGNFVGEDSFTYRLSDGSAPTTEATVTITVTANNLPTGQDDTIVTNEDQAVTLSPLTNDTDLDGDALVITTVGQPNNGTVINNGDGTLTYTPNANFNGSDSFTYGLADGQGGTDEATVEITVDPVNGAPTLATITQNGLEDQTVVFALADFAGAFVDEDEDDLVSIEIVSLLLGTLRLDGAEVAVNTVINANQLENLQYTPPANAVGSPIAFQVRASDGTDDSNLADVIVNLSPVNDAPSFDLISQPDQTTIAGEAFRLDNFATNLSPGPDDEANQTLSFNLTVEGDNIFSQQPDLDSLGTLTYGLTPDALGQATVRLTLVDDGGTANGGSDRSGEQTFTITAVQQSDATSTLNPVTVIFEADSAGLIRERFTYDSGAAGENNAVLTQLANDVINLGVEAAFDNLIGLYEVVDATGGVDTDGDGIADLFPQSQAAYALHAITNRVDAFSIRAGSGGAPERNTTVEQFGDVILTGGRLYAPFVIANGGAVGFDGFVSAENAETDGLFNDAATFAEDRVTYFPFIAANPDGVAHLRSFGNNIFGFEDLPSNLGISDNDFDDALFQFNFSTVV